MKGLKITLLLLLSVVMMNAQPTTGQIAYYSFDNCDASDDTGNGSDGNMFGNPGCDCGVSDKHWSLMELMIMLLFQEL